jgi:hypothetical protein
MLAPAVFAAESSFTAYGGAWTVQNGEVSVEGGPGYKLISNAPAFSNGEVGVEVFFESKNAGNEGLIVKTSDCGIGADRFTGYEVALDVAGHLVLGVHRQNFQLIRNVPLDVPINTWLSISVKMTASTLEVFINGKRVTQYEDRENPLASGQIGVRNWQREARFRNLWISTDGRKTPVPFANIVASKREQPVSAQAGRFRRYDDPTVRFDQNWQPTVAPASVPAQIGDPPWGMRSEKAGAKVEVDFIGTSVDLLHQAGAPNPWGVIYPDTGRPFGLASVEIDGKPATISPLTPNPSPSRGRGEPEAVIDTSRGGRTPLARGLPVGRHRLVLTNLGQAREPNGSTIVTVIGFHADTEPCANEAQRKAWRIADNVRGGEGWRQRAAELAASVKTDTDLPPMEELLAASRELDAATARMRAVHAEPLPSAMVTREKESWRPHPETLAYLERLAALKKRIDGQLAAADAFQFQAAGDKRFKELLASSKQMEQDVDTFFKAETRSLSPLIFFTGAPLRSGAVPNYVWQSEPEGGKWGCSIRTWDPGRPDAPAKTIFEEKDSLIFDLNLSYDAKTVFFSMRRNHAQCWQIYEITVDGSGLKQITSGPHYNVCPVPLPDGRLAFLSSRTPGYHTVCQSGPSMHVHVMNRDGSGARDLSTNTLTDFGLTILQDGRLLFTRWEYVDVTLTYRQSLWTQYPDGRQFQLYFGNTILDPSSFWQAREIPGRDAIVCTLAPHHHSPHGAIGLVKSQFGIEAPRDAGFRWITQEFPAILDLDLFWSYRDPYPVGENRFLVSYGGGGVKRFRLFLLDDMDNKQLIYEDPVTSCFYPQPLTPRPVPVSLPAGTTGGDAGTTRATTLHVPAAAPGQMTDAEAPLGRFIVADVYRGLEPAIERGRVKSIRIMEQLPKTVNRTWYTVMDQGPLMGASSYYAKRVWGYAPVEADGSAYFEAPAGKEIYFQACDEEGRELQRMTSATQLMPGETQSCAGCHESRQTAPAYTRNILAMKRSASPLKLPEWGNAGIIDFSKTVQPVLDKHCVSCHQGTNPDGGVSLTASYTRFFNMAYDNLVIRSRSDDVSRALYTGRSSDLPMVHSMHLLYGIMVPFKALGSGSLVSRLPSYFEESHCKVKVPAADRRRIYEWIDAMIPYYATSDYAHLEARSNRDKWGHPDRKDLLDWFTNGFAPVYNQRCGACHGKTNDLGLPTPPQWAWIDLTKPEWSSALTAHLAKSAGGRGIPAKDFQFANTTDPVYQLLLNAIIEGGKKAYELPEADMPGFVSRSKDRAFNYK